MSVTFAGLYRAMPTNKLLKHVLCSKPCLLRILCCAEKHRFYGRRFVDSHTTYRNVSCMKLPLTDCYSTWLLTCLLCLIRMLAQNVTFSGTLANSAVVNWFQAVVPYQYILEKPLLLAFTISLLCKFELCYVKMM